MSSTPGGLRRALISVSDKRGIIDFARRLQDAGMEILSTGGTARALEQAGIKVTPVDQVTGFPEILDGRVKTLHPAIHAGILARRDNPAHLSTLERMQLSAIDLVCVNLYPFEETVRGGATLEQALEQIDIGGPAMIRAAAKNHPDVLVVVDPDDYDHVASAVESGRVDQHLRKSLAAKAFAHTAFYDAVIAGYLSGDNESTVWPDRLVLPLRLLNSLRYGENPHQQAGLYAEALHESAGLAGARQLQGKELSYNNLQDTAAAWEAVWEFDRPAVVAVKHANPCGVAIAESPRVAFERARDADPVSIFGGIVAFNCRVDVSTAEVLRELFLEVIIAPEYEDAALEILAQRKNLRVLKADRPADVPQRGASRLLHTMVRSVPGALLVQSVDRLRPDPNGWQTVAGTVPEHLWPDITFAWSVVKHVKSNAIVAARDQCTLGIGAGQMNRVQAARLALEHAGERARGAVVASDAFLPFPDTVELCADYGVAVIVQPGGSVRDEEVIAAARRHGIAMVFTGVRHFRH